MGDEKIEKERVSVLDWLKKDLKGSIKDFVYIIVIVCLFFYIHNSVMLSEQCRHVLQKPCDFCVYGFANVDALVPINDSSYFIGDTVLVEEVN